MRSGPGKLGVYQCFQSFFQSINSHSSSPFGYCLSNPLRSQVRSANRPCIYKHVAQLPAQPLPQPLGLACRGARYCSINLLQISSMSSATVKRQIGDATFSAIGYGAMGIAVGYGPALPDEERFKVRRIMHVSRICADSSIPSRRSSMPYTRTGSRTGTPPTPTLTARISSGSGTFVSPAL